MNNLTTEKSNLFTMQQLADKFGVTKAEMSKRLREYKCEPAVPAKVGGRNQSPALYSEATFRSCQEEEEERKRQLQEEQRLTRQALAIPEQVQTKAFGMKLMSLVESQDPSAKEELEATTALLLAAMHRSTELSRQKAEMLEQEVQMLKDEHDTWMTWLRFIQRYKQFMGYRSWRMKDLKRNGQFLKDYCEANHGIKQIEVVGSKFDTQQAFHIEDYIAFFDL
jgi:hypothetical protein